MVSSTEIPKAILKTKMVDGFMGTPKYPISPAVIISGMMFGIREMIIILKDLNIKAINKEINNMANVNEMAKFFTKYLVPF